MIRRSAQMTPSPKKFRERHFLESAQGLLGRAWVVDQESESPDFVVLEDSRKFGLEVCEIFTGRQTRSGSEMKRAEVTTQEVLRSLQREYEAVSDVRLIVKFLGGLKAENLASVVPWLIAQDFSTKPIGYQVILGEDNGLRVFATRGYRNSNWFSINDRVGFVDRDPASRIANAIKRKSALLKNYNQTVGSDVRLLVVADRYLNSGKLMLESPIRLDARGFQVVYFLSHPESITIVAGNE